ncbi:MAG: hypothetical protein ABUL60_27805 [Myxococcales bacterium]
MVNGSGRLAKAHALLALALVGCGSPANTPGAGGSTTGGAVNAAGSTNATGGASASGAPMVAGNAAGGNNSVGGVGAVGPAQALTLNFSWSTYWLKGTTKTPLTCTDLGAQTVAFSISGESLAGAETLVASNGEFCDTGAYQNYPITLAPGEYYLSVSLSAGLASDANLKALVSGLTSFTVTPGATHVDIPEVKLVRITFPLKWTIEKGGSPVACDAVGATEVAFVLSETRENFSNTISWSQPCVQTPAETIAKPGTYELTATLQNGDSALATWKAPEMLTFSNDSAGVPPAITFKVP